MLQQGATYLGRFLQAHPNLNAISSHHLCFPLPELPDCHIHTLYLLRHPVERVLSVYRFERTQIAETPGAVNAKKMNFQEYVRWRLEPSSGATIRNYQTRYLSGFHHHDKQEVTEDEYSIAYDNLTGLAIVGTVERYNESMVMFEHRLQDLLPELDLSYLRQNTNAEIKRLGTEDRMESIRYQLGRELYEQVLAANRYDLALHQLSGSELDRFIAGVPDFFESLVQFDDRCKMLVKEKAARRQ